MNTPGRRIDPADENGIDNLHNELSQLLDTCCDQMKTTRTDFWNPPPLEELAKRFSLADSDQGAETKEVYEDLRAIMPYGANSRHPRWWGWVNGGGNFTAVGAELVAATMNTNMGARNQGAVEVERAVIEFLVRTAGLDQEKAFGILTTGTSQATILAFAAARVKCFGVDVKKKGILGLGPVAVYAKDGAHVCVAKACAILGHGSDCVRQFNSFDHLKQLVAEDKANGIKPMIVVGTAGCVNRGTYDNLAGIGEFCTSEDIWFHVDAAFGFWILLAESKWSSLINGISMANSIALDFHKWTGVPYSCGACLINDRDLHYKTFSDRPAYLAASNTGNPGSNGLAGGDLWFCDYGFDLSRGFMALKAWTVLKSVGTRKLGLSITDNCRQALTVRILGTCSYFILGSLGAMARKVESLGTAAMTQNVNVAPGPWKVALCSCCFDPMECCIGFFCPCCITFQMIQKAAPFELFGTGMIVTADTALLWTLAVWLIGPGTAGTVLLILMCLMMAGITKKYMITEGLITTLLKSVFCMCCFQIQAVRHAKLVYGEPSAV